MKENRKAVWQRLRQDVRRYQDNYNLSSLVKVLFIVDSWAVFFLRLEEWSQTLHPTVRFFVNLLLILFRPLVQGLTGTRIFTGAQIGGGLLLHTSVGIVIARTAVIGENCTLLNGVTVAYKANSHNLGAPVIGNNVKLMSGCKVIGPVVIGDNAVIGANAVVLSDIPANSTAVGIPAVIKRGRKGGKA